MTSKQKLLYFSIAVLIFVSLATIEFFFAGDLVELVDNKWSTKLICFIVMLLLFNPFIVYKLLELIPFKVKGLKVASGINEALKQENLD